VLVFWHQRVRNEKKGVKGTRKEKENVGVDRRFVNREGPPENYCQGDLKKEEKFTQLLQGAVVGKKGGGGGGKKKRGIERDQRWMLPKERGKRNRQSTRDLHSYWVKGGERSLSEILKMIERGNWGSTKEKGVSRKRGFRLTPKPLDSKRLGWEYRQKMFGRLGGYKNQRKWSERENGEMKGGREIQSGHLGEKKFGHKMKLFREGSQKNDEKVQKSCSITRTKPCSLRGISSTLGGGTYGEFTPGREKKGEERRKREWGSWWKTNLSPA